jgi:hypothetical protein
MQGLTEQQSNHLEAVFEVIGRALGQQPGIDKEKLARDIKANIPPGRIPNLAYVLCTSMADAVLSNERISALKDQWPTRQHKAALRAKS